MQSFEKLTPLTAFRSVCLFLCNFSCMSCHGNEKDVAFPRAPRRFIMYSGIIRTCRSVFFLSIKTDHRCHTNTCANHFKDSDFVDVKLTWCVTHHHIVTKRSWWHERLFLSILHVVLTFMTERSLTFHTTLCLVHT